MFDDKKFTKRVLFVVFVLVLALVTIYLSIRAADLIVVVFAAWITAETADISVRFLVRHKVKQGLAVALTILVAFLVVSLVATIVIPPVVRELIDLFKEIENVPELVTNAINSYESFRVSNEIVQMILPPAPDNLQTVLLGESGQGNLLITAVEQAIPVISNIGAFVGLTVGQVVLYLFLTILIMLEPTIYYDALLGLIPASYEQRAGEILNLVRKNVESWSGAMLLSIAITSLLYFLVLGIILRLPNALALSAIAGIATIIPTIGNTLALIPVLVVSAQMGLPTFIAATILYVTIGTIQDRIITPTIVRSELSIPAAAQVTFQLVLATLIGPIGLIMAIPLLAILITLVRELYVFDVLGKKPAPVEVVEADADKRVVQESGVEDNVEIPRDVTD